MGRNLNEHNVYLCRSRFQICRLYHVNILLKKSPYFRQILFWQHFNNKATVEFWSSILLVFFTTLSEMVELTKSVGKIGTVCYF